MKKVRWSDENAIRAAHPPPDQALECAERTSLALSDGQKRFSIYTTYFITLYFDSYKV